MPTGTRKFSDRQASLFALMIIASAVLSWIGAVVYLRADGTTTVKPLCGMALALIFICDGKYRNRILLACVLGGVAAKFLLGYGVLNSILVPVLISGSVFVSFKLCCRLIGPSVDFRVWKQLNYFIGIAAVASAATGAAYAIAYYLVNGDPFLKSFQSWWLTTTLSFAVFTPVTVLCTSMQTAPMWRHKLRALSSFCLLFAALYANFITFRLPSLFLVPLALVVVALACEIEGVAVALVITEIVLAASAIFGHGIAALAHLSLGQQLYFTQILLGVLVTVFLPTASAIGEQRRVRDEMAEALRREAEAASALRQSEERYRLMANHASDIMVQADAGGRIRYISPSCKRLAGYEPSEMLGTTSDSLILEEDRASVRATKAELLRRGMTEGLITYRVRHRDGRTMWFENRLTFLFDEAGEYSGFFGIVRDITEREEIKKHLIDACERAEAANIAKSEFLANMSHEIRTPLTSVIGFAELLHEQGTLDERMRGFVSRIRNGSRALLALINDILDYSKLESGQIALSPAPSSIIQIASEVFDLLAVQAQAKGLRLHLETSDWVRSAGLLVDSHRVRQILLNLVGNAVKFTDSGFVTLLIGCSAETHPTLPNRLSCRVVDSGEGIASDRLDAIFDRFSQADLSTSKRHGGTGLGLAICKGLVEAMDGKIGAISEPGNGSTFWFEIAAPLSSEPGLVQVNDPGPTAISAQGVLIVDDQEGNRAYVRSALEHLDIQVVEASSGEDAIALAADLKFDMILMDIRMPGMDGIAAMKAIRSANICKCPIIAFTAEGEHKTLENLLDEGFDATLSKPLILSQLRNCIRDHVHGGIAHDNRNVRHVA